MKRIFSSYVWDIPSAEKTVYLTFDDGPHPSITPWVLEELRKYNAKATFFCIGDNVQKHPAVYHQIIDEGHAVGNHTYNHLNGWQTNDEVYLVNIAKATELIDSSLFRPPYGRIRRSAAKRISSATKGSKTKIIMWDVLSADFDQTIAPQDCLKRVLKKVSQGSIVVFHDSEKAERNLRFVLPKTLDYLSKNGYKLDKILIDML